MRKLSLESLTARDRRHQTRDRFGSLLREYRSPAWARFGYAIKRRPGLHGEGEVYELEVWANYGRQPYTRADRYTRLPRYIATRDRVAGWLRQNRQWVREDARQRTAP